MTRPTRGVTTRFLGELVVIVAGVLIALWVDGWAERRADREAEIRLLGLISSELRTHISDYGWITEAVVLKEAHLREVRRTLDDPGAITDTLSFLETLVFSTNFGWGQPSPERAAFESIVESGQMALIRDDALRTDITRYYRIEAESQSRMSSRLTPYAAAVFALVPLKDDGFHLADDVEPGAVLETVLASNIGALVTAELNRTVFLIDQFSGLEERAQTLVDRLAR